MVFDFRDDKVKALLREFGNKLTFREGLKVRDDELRIIASNEV